MKTKLNRTTAVTCILTLVGFLLLACGTFVDNYNRFLIGFVQILGGFALYISTVLLICNRNWLDIRAVFSAVWLVTIGLSCLRLTDYQEPWQTATWLLLAVAFAVFQIGANLGITCGPRIMDRLCKKNTKKQLPQMNGNRLFWVCVITTLIGLACFLCNVAIKGFIPCFAHDASAYITFYTKFHVFAVAATGAAGLCYYTIITQKLSLVHKIILGICTAYLVLIFPILVISRGTFVVAALSLTVSIFYLHKKRFLALLLCLTSIMGIYLVMSNMREYSDAQLDTFFEPSDIVIVAPPETTEPCPETDAESSPSCDHDHEPPCDDDVITFTLSPKVAFLYTYLTVSHDNFNEAVQNATKFTHGSRQLAPFNVILRSQWINEKNWRAETFLVREHLNTTNLLGDFYYDFGGWGVAVCMLLWAFVFGLIQSIFEHKKNPFVLLALGNTMTPIAFSFFSTWLSTFSQWMLWGVALLLAAATYITVTPKAKITNK